MKRIADAIWDTRWTVVLTLVFTIMFGDYAGRVGMSIYNQTADVVNMSAQVVTKDTNSIVLHITGEKLRNCRFVRLTAYYAFKGNGMLVEAFKERLDGPHPDGATRPVGMHDIGYWRIWPTDEASKVLMYVHHECSGETVLSKIAEVTI